MRLPDWENLLAEYLADVRLRPFEWGEHDCILHACAAVAAMTGDDPAAAYRGQYSDRIGAARVLRDLGRGTLLQTVDASFVRKPVALAQRGDLVEWNGGIGICLGAVGAFVGEAVDESTGEPLATGLIDVPRREWRRAWSV